jgi:hypothetical protein
MFDDRIQAASSRYDSNAVLVGRMSRDGDSWTVRWQLMWQGQDADWQDGPGDLDSVVTAGLGHVADMYASDYALQSGSDFSDTALVTVDGVSGIEAYARVSKYLAGLTPVTKVELVAIDKDSIRFRVHSRGTTDSLAQAIALGGMLQPETSSDTGGQPAAYPAGAPASAPEQELKFQYQP